MLNFFLGYNSRDLKNLKLFSFEMLQSRLMDKAAAFLLEGEVEKSVEPAQSSNLIQRVFAKLF